MVATKKKKDTFLTPFYSVPDFIDLTIEKKHSEHLYISPQKDRERAGNVSG